MENQNENQTISNQDINSQNERKNEMNDELNSVEVLMSEEVKMIESYKSRIMTNWRKVVVGIIESGRILADAKEHLSPREMNDLMEDLPFSYSMAKKLMKIGRDQRLVRDDIIPILPNSWGVVHKISTMPDDKFNEAVDLGIIHPGVRIPDLNKFLNPEMESLKNETPYYSYGVVLIEKNHADAETIDSVYEKINESIKNIEGVNFKNVDLGDILKDQSESEYKYFSTSKELIKECTPSALELLESFVGKLESGKKEIIDLEIINEWEKKAEEINKKGLDKLSNDEIFHYLKTFGLLGQAETFWHFYTSPINKLVLKSAA